MEYQMTALEAARLRARDRADKPAFITPTRTWTFAQTDAFSNRIAQGLLALGVGHGDRVAILTKQTVECLALMLAAQKIGAVCMPVNWRLAPPEIAYVVDHGEAKLLVADAEFLPAVAGLELAHVKLRLITDRAVAGGPRLLGDWAAGYPDEDPGYDGQRDDTALQLYSSGTTGLPKGVELSHRSLAAGFERAVPECIEYTGGDSVMLNALPTFHIAGIGMALIAYMAGGTSVMMPDFDPAKVLEAIEEHRITHAFLVPAMIQFMLQVPGADRRDYSSLKAISYGASPISERVLVDALRTFKCNFVQVYGLTETTGAISALPPEDHVVEGPKAVLLRSAGKAIRGVELGVFDPATGDRLPDDEVGEIWIRSAQNMKGYWRNPKATADAFVGLDERGIGWFRSGDAGYMRGEYVFMHDRIKDMIISGGENIYPAEVENVLMKHPAVADGAVIGVPDPTWGEAVKAVVVPRPGVALTGAEVIAFMRERLAHYKCPKSVDIVKEIPRNPSGKILKRVLREPYWKDRDRNVA
ncbi:MAG TPA: long-chain-fatty-acid--CoA ligase [Quisquiliibacterium sp.]|nr:long-chain-fatty-acid--CoA ligase [Quisquiliibacterium sp.]